MFIDYSLDNFQLMGSLKCGSWSIRLHRRFVIINIAVPPEKKVDIRLEMIFSRTVRYTRKKNS